MSMVDMNLLVPGTTRLPGSHGSRLSRHSSTDVNRFHTLFCVHVTLGSSPENILDTRKHYGRRSAPTSQLAICNALISFVSLVVSV